MQPIDVERPARGWRCRFSTPGGLSGLLLLLLAVARVVPAPAATLMVHGPGGAEVLVDGRTMAVLPMDDGIELEAGSYAIEVRLPGHRSHLETIELSAPESRFDLAVELRPMSRRSAVAYSAVLAGLGQLYQRRRGTGWTMMGLQLGAWSVAAWAETRYQDRVDEYEVLDRQYDAALAPGEINRLAAARDAAYDDVETYQTWRNVALGAGLAIGLWSMVDAWRGHDRFFVAAGPLVAPDPGRGSIARLAGRRDLRVGYRLRF